MEILKYPHPSLFEKCVEVTVFGPELNVLLDGMADAMKAKAGIGLAANQVGLHYRMFVMMDKGYKLVKLVNPVIVDHSWVSANLKEGCLSAPGEFLVVDERKQWVQVKFQDETGKEHKRVFEGIYSVCVQHEIDHLDGKSHLQSPSLSRDTRRMLAKKWGLK